MSSSGKEWYREQLSTPEWKARRQEVYARDGRACVECGKSGVRINCHHSYYVSKKYPWEYPLEAFVTLCDQCHDAIDHEKVMKFASAEDAEMWFIFEEVETEFFQLERQERADRIERLEDQGAVWDGNGRYYSLSDANDRPHFFDEDGYPM